MGELDELNLMGVQLTGMYGLSTFYYVLLSATQFIVCSTNIGKESMSCARE